VANNSGLPRTRGPILGQGHQIALLTVLVGVSGFGSEGIVALRALPLGVGSNAPCMQVHVVDSDPALLAHNCTLHWVAVGELVEGEHSFVL